ncbi:hypothetical protein ACJX0J_035743 [Zea mays]
MADSISEAHTWPNLLSYFAFYITCVDLLQLLFLAVAALIFDMLEVPSGTNVEYASLTFCFKNCFLAQETLQKCVGMTKDITPEQFEGRK